MHAEPLLPNLGLEAKKVQKREGLQELAHIVWAHESCYQTLPAAGAVDDGAAIPAQ